MASASQDRTIKLWHSVTGEELRTLRGHMGQVRALAFSPDGRSLASGSLSPDRSVRIWDVGAGKELRTLRGQNGGILCVAYSPDGKLLAAASADQTVKLWDTDSGREQATLFGHLSFVEGVAFSPDGKRIASASRDRTVKLWQTATGRELSTLSGHTESVRGVAFSPDGRTLASASQDRTVRLWDLESAQARAILRGHAAGIDRVAFSPDGRRIASSSEDATVRLWDVATGQEVLSLRRRSGHRGDFQPGRPHDHRLEQRPNSQNLGFDANFPRVAGAAQVERLGRVAFRQVPRHAASSGLDFERTSRSPSPWRIRTQAGGNFRQDPGGSRRSSASCGMLFQKPMLRSDVLAGLRQDKALSEPLRRTALAIADQTPEYPDSLFEVSCAWSSGQAPTRPRIAWPSGKRRLPPGSCPRAPTTSPP